MPRDNTGALVVRRATQVGGALATVTGNPIAGVALEAASQLVPAIINALSNSSRPSWNVQKYAEQFRRPNAQNSSTPKSTSTRAPVAIARNVRLPSPGFRRTGVAGSITITHREYITDVKGSTTFSPIDYGINPGLGQTFDYLSNIADSYQYYKIDKLSFEYEPLCPSSTR